MPVHRCTAMATLSSKWEPMASASIHVLRVLAEWWISRSSCIALSLSPPIDSTAKGRCTACIALALM